MRFMQYPTSVVSIKLSAIILWPVTTNASGSYSWSGLWAREKLASDAV